MSIATWFMVVLLVCNIGGAIGYAMRGDYASAWIWASYASSQAGWVVWSMRGTA